MHVGFINFPARPLADFARIEDMRIGIFNKYIAKSWFVFFTGVLGILTLVIFMNHFIRIVKTAMAYGASWGWIALSLFHMLPDVVCLSAPMAFQISVLLTLSTMSEHGELIALRAAGFSFKAIVKPLFICACIVSGVLFVCNNWITPHSFKKVLILREEARSKITKVNLEPKTFLDLGDWQLYVESLDSKTNEAHQIHLIKKADDGALSTKVNASGGKVILSKTAIGLHLTDGQMQRLDDEDPTSFIAANFADYTMSIPLTRQRTRDIRASELGTPRLLRYIHKHPLMTQQQKNEFRTEASMRNVLAFSPIVLLLISCPIGFSLGKRTNKGWGMLFSVIIIFTFYVIGASGLALGKKFACLSFVAPWLPIVIGLVLAKYLWKKRLNI